MLNKASAARQRPERLVFPGLIIRQFHFCRRRVAEARWFDDYPSMRYGCADGYDDVALRNGQRRIAQISHPAPAMRRTGILCE
jgi:hypothetical protein